MTTTWDDVAFRRLLRRLWWRRLARRIRRVATLGLW